jgi:hypothetical protein
VATKKRGPVKAKKKPSEKKPAVKKKKPTPPKLTKAQRQANARKGWETRRAREAKAREEFERRSKAAKLGRARRVILGDQRERVEALIRTIPGAASVAPSQLRPVFGAHGAGSRTGLVWHVDLENDTPVPRFARTFSRWAQRKLTQENAAEVKKRTMIRLRFYETLPDDEVPPPEKHKWLTASSSIDMRKALLQAGDFADMETRQTSNAASGLRGFISALQIMIW